MNILLKRKGSLRSVLIPIVLITVLLFFGTVYADGGGITEDPVDVPAEEALVQDAQEPAEVVVENSDAPPPTDEDIYQEEAEDREVISVEDPEDEILPEGSVEEGVEDENIPEPEILAEEEIAVGIIDLPLENFEAGRDEVVLVDGEGETLDLASEASLEVISSADPWWIVGSVKYAFIKTGGTCPSGTTAGVTCFESGTPISAALSYMDTTNKVPTDGLLHVEPDTYSETVTIDGTSGNGYLAKLKGLVSDGSSNDTFIIGDVTISNTLLGFTLTGFTITGKVDIHGNTGTLTLTDLDVSDPADSGIEIDEHNGAVNIDRVKSDNNAEYGLTVDNTAGSAGVTITNSEFSHNNNGTPGVNWVGLAIDTNGTISLNGVSACDNNGNGAQLVAVKGTTIKNSVFNNNNEIAGNPDFGNGIYINNNNTANHILLENVHADGNANYGIYFISTGNVTLKNVTAYKNSTSSSFSGVYIDNRTGTGTVSITNNTFKENGLDGLIIYSHKNVTLNGITALDNGSYGVYVDNCDEYLGECLGTGTVSVSGTLPNYFNRNGADGLRILSGGNVTLSYFQTNENDSYGVNIRNNYTGRSGNVTLNLSYKPVLGTWQNTISDNVMSGLFIASFGNILIDQCAVEGNTEDGSSLDNHLAASAKSVTIKNSHFNENGWAGLKIESKGNISLYDVEANQNTLQHGAYIRNDYGSGSVSITGSGSAQRDFSGNGLSGIYVQSVGVVTLKNIYAVGNGRGAFIDNASGISKAVSISNADFSDSISGEGLYINSKGAITLTDVVSNGSLLGYGALLSNKNANSAQTIKITRGQFNDNQNESGLYVDSLGTITLSSVQASGNGYYGASIDACIYDGILLVCEASGGVTVTGSGNDFSNNGYIGLSVTSKNSVVLNNISADNNIDNGLSIDHSYANCSGNVSLNAAKGNLNSFSNNGYQGIDITSMGNITLAQFKANNNAYFGVVLTNEGSSSAKTVSVSYAEINDNQNTGLDINSKGTVTLSGVQVLRSSLHWMEINDDLGEKVVDRLPSDPAYDEIYWFDGNNGQNGTIFLTSESFDAFLEFYDEEWHLLDWDDNSGGGNDAQISYLLTTDGIYYVRVSSAEAGDYGEYLLGIDGGDPFNVFTNYYGVRIENSNGSGDVNIKTSSLGYGLDTRDNNDSGLFINTHGKITLSGVNANFNGGDRGARLENSAAIGKTVSLTNCNFDHNDGQGIYLTSQGTITWSTGSASANMGGQGAYLANNAVGTSYTVNISKAIFNENGKTGVAVDSLGNITLANVSASGNLDGLGADLNNCQSSGPSGCDGSGSITVSGTYGLADFNNNSYIGLRAYSRGHISLTNVNASGNSGDDGLYLTNDYANAYGNITVKTTSSSTYSNLNDNAGDGLQTASRGTVTLSNQSAWGNANTGIAVDNTTAATAKTVTLTRIQSGENIVDGVFVSSVGAIALSYVESLDNNNMGICLDNNNIASPQSITVSRTKVDGNTANTGLEIVANGVVTLNNITANNNYEGVHVVTSGTSAKLTVLSSLGENEFSGNTTNGLWAYSDGDVSLSKVTADWNGASGVKIITEGKLTVTTISLYRNGGTGLYVDGGTGATISGLQSYINGSSTDGDGLYVTLNSSSTFKIINSVLTGNYGSGIFFNEGYDMVLLNTYYFGNDLNNTGDDNLFWH